jgi:hypothetical protein
MFSRYFGDRYFAARFWPNLGAEIFEAPVTAYARVIVPHRARRIVVLADERVIR